MKVFASFAKIGAPVTEHAEPIMLKGGILTLNVADSAWLTELTFLKKEILDRVNRGLQKPAVRDVRFKLGSVSKKRDTKASPPKLTEAESAKVEAWASEIASDEVRAAMISAARWSLKRPPPARAIVEGPPGPAPRKPEPQPEPSPEPVQKDRWPKDRDRWKR